MHLIPVPELVLVLVIALGVRALRMLGRSWRGRFTPRAGQAREPAGELADTQRKQAQLMASCVLLVIISVPLILRLVPPNGVYGFRTPLTRSSSAIWYAANAFMGWALVIAAVISVTALAVLPATVNRWVQWAAFLVPLSGAIVASFLYLQQLG
jgi:hypothetical protein